MKHISMWRIYFGIMTYRSDSQDQISGAVPSGINEMK